MVEGVAWVTSSLGALKHGVKGPRREKEVLGSGSAVGPQWKERENGLGRLSMNQGLLKVLHRATNRLRFIFRAETDCQNSSPTAYFTGRLGAISTSLPSRWGHFKSRGGKGGWEERGGWGRQLSASARLQDNSCRCGQSNSCQFPEPPVIPQILGYGRGRALSRLYKRIQGLLGHRM